ncbi:SsrA-binding protein SmpB [Mycoplasmatota bacterium]|nr:SsrA-binding protein SmpB [Mycoplasmatota bacterium]
MPKGEGRIIAQNKKARHDYHIEEELECGIVLHGTEIKSIRKGQINLKDSYARIKDDGMYVINMHISPYEQGNRFNHDPIRDRKLLLHKNEIRKLNQKIQLQGVTLVPLKVYIKDGYAKLELGVAKGKNVRDKRQDLKAKQAKRDMASAMKYKY